MSIAANAPSAPSSIDVQSPREARILGYDALEQSKTRDGTSHGLQQRDKDLRLAEDIAWSLYSDVNDPSPHETNLLLANIFFTKGGFAKFPDRDSALDNFESARYYAEEALKHNPGHRASQQFKTIIDDAITAEKPIKASTPVLPSVPAPYKHRNNKGQRRSGFNGAADTQNRILIGNRVPKPRNVQIFTPAEKPAQADTPIVQSTPTRSSADESAQQQKWKELAHPITDTDPDVAEIMETFDVSPAQARYLRDLDV